MKKEKEKANTVGMERLKRLLEHMEHGKLSVRRFDFRIIRNDCGTAGCMAGELPGLFPEWEFFLKPDFSDAPGVRLKGEFSDLGLIYGAMWFFGLERTEVLDLFFPAGPLEETAGRLPYEATREEVAANLRKFIRRKAKANK
jgi:hypothetical protein